MKKLIVLILLGALGWYGGSYLEGYSRKLDRQYAGEIFSSVDVGEQKLIALTLDDGPWNQRHAQHSIDQLDRLGIKVTYFLNGRGIKANMPLVKQMVRRGHQIGNHSYNHKKMYFMLPSTLEHKAGDTTRLIRESGYRGQILFRAPYGRKLYSLPMYLAKRGIVSATWSIAPEWPAHASPQALADTIVKQVKPGSIILLHPLNNSNEQSRQAIELFVPTLKRMGYQFVTLNQLRAAGE